jgi:hypothetical protein
MTEARTIEQVTDEIEREREELAAAVSQLRGELRRATDPRVIARQRLPQLLAVAAVGVSVLVGIRALKRRRREEAAEPVPRLRLGRFVVVERV